MRHRLVVLAATFSLGLGVGLGGAQVGHAQRAGITSQLLMKTQVSGDDTKEAVILSVEIAPGGTTGRHFHYGDEYAVVIEGAVELNVEGRASKTARTGEAYHNEAKIVHETRNVGTVPARLVNVFIVEKGKPLVERMQ